MALISSDEEARLNRFVESYNSIDKALREMLVQESHTDFKQLIKIYERKNKWWRDARSLESLASLRNAIIHNRAAPYTYMAVPLPEALEEIEAIKRRLVAPRLAEPRMHGNVLKVKTKHSLQEVFRHIASNDFSQFPVYNEIAFVGLITENGITRWLADHLTDKDIDLVAFGEATVQDVLKKEESQSNYAFISKGTTAAEVDFLFASDPRLEAVLLTHSGKKIESLLAIATRWDVPLDQPRS